MDSLEKLFYRTALVVPLAVNGCGWPEKIAGTEDNFNSYTRTLKQENDNSFETSQKELDAYISAQLKKVEEELTEHRKGLIEDLKRYNSESFGKGSGKLDEYRAAIDALVRDYTENNKAVNEKVQEGIKTHIDEETKKFESAGREKLKKVQELVEKSEKLKKEAEQQTESPEKK